MIDDSLIKTSFLFLTSLYAIQPALALRVALLNKLMMIEPALGLRTDLFSEIYDNDIDYESKLQNVIIITHHSATVDSKEILCKTTARAIII